MGILIDIFLFGIAAVLGAWWFSVVILPIFYGLPKSIYWTIKGKLKARSSLAYLGNFLLWQFIFILAALLLLFFSPRTAEYLYNSLAFFLGQWFGVFGSLFSALSASGRHDLNEDFWAAMARFQKQAPADSPLQPTQELHE